MQSFLGRTLQMELTSSNVTVGPINEEEKFNGFHPDSNNFKTDVDWTPMITEEELTEYSKKEYWGVE